MVCVSDSARVIVLLLQLCKGGLDIAKKRLVSDGSPQGDDLSNITTNNVEVLGREARGVHFAGTANERWIVGDCGRG